MSAKLDRTQTIKFYYGNAMVDLADFLPAETAEDFIQPEQSQSFPQEKQRFHSNVDIGEVVRPLHERQRQTPNSVELQSLHSTLDRSLDLMSKLQKNQREIGFLIADLKRMIG